MEIFLSIITINFNNLDGLKKTVDSVLSQTYNEFEYIVIDGGSSDGSNEYLENKREKLSVLISENDTGIYNAMNKGIRNSTGEFLLFLNSGDVLNGVMALADFINFENFGGDIIYGDYKFLNGEKKYLDKLTPFNLFRASLPHQSSLIKRSLFNQFGLYDEKFKIVSDKAFYIKCLLSNKVIFNHIECPLSLVDLDGISNNVEFKKFLEKENDLMLKEYFSVFYSDYKQMLENQKEINDLRKKTLPDIIIRSLKKIKFYFKKWN
jgi:glycosyltransferase involved in cell wall biosynthesis